MKKKLFMFDDKLKKAFEDLDFDDNIDSSEAILLMKIRDGKNKQIQGKQGRKRNVDKKKEE